MFPASVSPKVPKPIRRHFGIANGVLDVLVAEISLQRPRIDALIRQQIAAGVPEHVRMNWERQLGARPNTAE
jgi:hypothetical protein